MQLRYNLRLYPTPGQQLSLARTFGCSRWVYNQALATRKAAYAAGSGWVSSGKLSTRLITLARKEPETAWLGQVSATVLQQALRDLDAAYRNFFESQTGRRKGPRMGEPQFRSRRDRRESIRFVGESFSVHRDGKLHLARIGDVEVRWSRSLPSKPSSVTIIKDASGRYFASFAVVTDEAEDLDRFPATDTEVGIDLGLASFAVLSDGTVVENPRFLRRAERKLKKAQQDLARKQKGSNNRKKSVVKVARAHARVADARRDHHHKLTTQIIAENQGVYVEDLAVAALARGGLRGHAKSVHDAGWSSFVNMLEYKAARYGRTFNKVDRFAPTSQVCSACGVKDGPKPLSVREWQCAGCGAVHDRDLNAAKNILALGRRESLNACGAQVRPGLVPAQRDEAGTHRSDLIGVIR